MHDPHNLITHRICGANFDEIVYADDTICVSTDTKAMNKFLKDIEEEGEKYGLKLNKGKCELLTTSHNADIKFKDGTKVPRKPEVTYLGCQIKQYSNRSEEISKQIMNCVTILRTLDIFWRHCDVNIFQNISPWRGEKIQTPIRHGLSTTHTLQLKTDRSFPTERPEENIEDDNHLCGKNQHECRSFQESE